MAWETNRARLNPRQYAEEYALIKALWPWRTRALELVRQKYPDYPITTFNRRYDDVQRVLNAIAEIDRHPDDRSYAAKHALKDSAEPFAVEDLVELILRERNWLLLASQLFGVNARLLSEEGPWGRFEGLGETVKQRARRLVLEASRMITSSESLAETLRVDDRGVFERMAMDLLDQSVVPATHQGLTDKQVDDAVIAEICYQALTAQLNVMDRARRRGR